MPNRSPQHQLIEAKRIAQANGCFVIEKADKYLVFRKTDKPTYVGARATPEALRSFVRKVTQHTETGNPAPIQPEF